MPNRAQDTRRTHYEDHKHRKIRNIAIVFACLPIEPSKELPVFVSHTFLTAPTPLRSGVPRGYYCNNIKAKILRFSIGHGMMRI